MSLRLSSSQSSHLVSLWGGLGIPGSEVPTTGDNGGSPLANDGITASLEYRIATVTLPSAGTLTVYPDTSFEFAGAPDGEYEWIYRVFEDSIDRGTATEFLIVGSPAASFAATTLLPAFSGSASVSDESPVASFDITTALPAFAGSASVSPVALVDVTAALPTFSGSVNVSPVTYLNSTVGLPVFTGAFGIAGEAPIVSFDITAEPPVFTGSAHVSPRFSISTETSIPNFAGSSSSGALIQFNALTDLPMFDGSAYGDITSLAGVKVKSVGTTVDIVAAYAKSSGSYLPVTVFVKSAGVYRLPA